MKAVPFEEKRLLKWQPPFIVQPKYDGVRCRAVPIDTGPGGNEYLLLSSEEHIIYSVPHLNEALSKLGLRSELDGELYNHSMNFNEIQSITSRTVNISSDSTEIQFHVFDIVNDRPQMKRLTMIENLRNLSPFIRVSPFWICESLDDIMKVYDKIINNGYEGIIVRHFLAPYERKRSTMVMKFKPKQSDEYEIIGYEEELSNEKVPKGSLGAFVCLSGDGNSFNVGTGFTADQRICLWSTRDKLIGKMCKISYQHLTSGRKVPRFPVFVTILD
jgi:DNA ligase-1